MDAFYLIDDYLKLFEEHSIVRDEYKHKVRLIKENWTSFNSQIESLLEDNPKLKEFLSTDDLKNNSSPFFHTDEDEKEKQQTDEPIILNSKEIVSIFRESANTNKDNNFDKQDEIKKLYREIVKITHPDRSKDDSLLNIYLLAGEYYEQMDYISLVTLSHSLGIIHKVDDQTIRQIIKNIEEYKFKNKILENDITLIWFSSENKTGIIIEYISQIIKSKKGEKFIIL